jgi:hypothetical protein
VPCYYLAAHAYACLSGDQLVLLDLEAGRYLALDYAQAAALTPFVHGWPVPASGAPPDASLLAELRRRSLLTNDACAGKPANPLEMPRASTDLPLRSGAPPLTSSEILGAITATTRAVVLVRGAPLRRIVRRVSARRQRSVQSAGSADETRRLIEVFEYVRPFLFSGRDACFIECLALLEFLSPRAVSPTWVFGVRTKPFAAHCWLQLDDCVLTDSVERTGSFTPIMAV